MQKIPKMDSTTPQNGRKGEGHPDAPPQLLLLLPAKGPGYHDNHAYRHPIKKSDQQVGERFANTDRRQSCVTDKVAHNHGIYTIVQILK